MTISNLNANQNNGNPTFEKSFDDIRPLKDAEVKYAIESLLKDGNI